MKKKIDRLVEIDLAMAKFRKELEAKLDGAEDTVEVLGGLERLFNKKVLFICAGYFYEVKLTGVNATHIELEDAYVVYNPETLTTANIAKCFRDKLPAKQWYIERGAIESYGELA